MQQLILILHVLVAIAIVSLVLLQHGRGADVGASFGSGASNTMFGSSGSLPFLMKVTCFCAALFFATSISLSYLATRSARSAQKLNIPTLPAAPVKKTVPLPESSSDTNNSGISFAPVMNDGKAPEKKKSSSPAKKQG